MATRLARGGRQLTNVGTITAPIRGMNENQPAYNANSEYCFFTYNMMPSDYGMKTRAGSRLWAQATDGSTVRTLIPYVGYAEDRSLDRLHAITYTGIFNFSGEGQTKAAPDLAFPVTTGDAGFGNFTVYTNDAGDHFVKYADGENGLYEYDGSTDTWAVDSGINGPNLTAVRFVTAHKSRMWLVEEDSPDAWYLPVGQKQGNATKFYFGAQSKHGGELVGLYNMTMDGGAGIDDMLVTIHRSGDVTLWQGEDPADATTWRIVGVWYIGAIPAGRRAVSEYGGDVHILCASGILSIMDMVRGVSVSQATSTGFGNQINSSLRRIINGVRGDTINLDEPGWSMYYSPSEKSYVVMIPPQIVNRSVQLVYDPVVDGWGWWRDVAMVHMASIRGTQFFGTTDGRVYYFTGSLDLMDFEGENGLPIQYSLATVASDLSSPGTFKKVEYIRPIYRATTNHKFDLKALYEFNPAEIAFQPGPDPVSSSIWDDSEWDASVWSGSISPFETVRGGEGMGRNIAVAMRGEVTVRTQLILFDVMFQQGGMM